MHKGHRHGHCLYFILYNIDNVFIIERMVIYINNNIITRLSSERMSVDIGSIIL